jgi:hypothetical protein
MLLVKHDFRCAVPSGDNVYGFFLLLLWIVLAAEASGKAKIAYFKVTIHIHEDI